MLFDGIFSFAWIQEHVSDALSMSFGHFSNLTRFVYLSPRPDHSSLMYFYVNNPRRPYTPYMTFPISFFLDLVDGVAVAAQAEWIHMYCVYLSLCDDGLIVGSEVVSSTTYISQTLPLLLHTVDCDMVRGLRSGSNSTPSRRPTVGSVLNCFSTMTVR